MTMTAKEVFSKTLVFGWIKLGLGLLNILIAIVLFAILMGIQNRNRTCRPGRYGQDYGARVFLWRLSSHYFLHGP